MKQLLLPFVCFTVLTATSVAVPPMHPGTSKTLVEAWNKSDAKARMIEAAKADRAAQARVTRPVLIEEIIVVESGDEGEVQERARRAVRSVNTRHWQRRVATDTGIHQGAYPEKAGWVTRDGQVNAARFPWWVW